MKLRLIGLALAGAMLVAGPASAMVLSVSGGTGDSVPANFNPTGFPGGVAAGDSITVFNNANAGTGGLSLSSNATLRFEFLGSEADFTNVFDFGGTLFSTATAAVGDVVTVAAAGGVIPFSFLGGGSGGTATNGGPIDAPLLIAFANLGDNSFLAMFNDGGGPDADFDDLVVRVSVSQVPLPPAVWLLLSAVLGLVSFARIRRKGPQTA